MTTPAVQLAGLTRSFGDTTVLRGLDLTVPRGEIFALLGPNGAGKTTCVRILATLLDADGGSAQVAGYDVRTQRSEVRSRISLTGQYAAVDELQTGAENLRMIARFAHLGRRAAAERTAELLNRFDLEGAADRRVSTYSGGMRRRLDLAASLVRRPEVLFLDEPTTGLDPRSRAGMWDVVTDLARSGTTVFLTTQYLEEADRLADRIAVLDGGRIVASGTAVELKRTLGRQRLELTAADDTAWRQLTGVLGGAVVTSERAERRIVLPVDGDARGVRELLDNLDPDRTRIEHFAVGGASLDDVFLALTGSVHTEVTHV